MVYLRTQLALHIRFTEYTGIYNVRTGFVDKQDGELTAKMCGSPQLPILRSPLLGYKYSLLFVSYFYAQFSKSLKSDSAFTGL